MIRPIAGLLAAAFTATAIAGPNNADQTIPPSKTKQLSLIEKRRLITNDIYRQGRGDNRRGERSQEFLAQVEQERAERIIYGLDDRFDIYEVSDPEILGWAQAACVVVSTSELTFNGDGTVDLITVPWTTAGFGSLCTSEPFYGQLTIGNCSGFLVGQDIVVTAGHCIDSSDIGNWAYVFGFDQRGFLLDPFTTVPEDDVYIVDAVDDHALGGGFDHSVTRTDRPVVGYTPLPIRRSGEVSAGDPLMMIGHPATLPKKVAGGAEVKEVLSGQGYFTSNLDAYGGNSGSMIINRNTGEIEGILVRGNTDYTTSGGCTISNSCADSGCPTWEECSKVDAFASFIPPLGIAVSAPTETLGFGPVGGPFIDAGVTYTLSNTTDTALDYTWLVTGDYPILVNGIDPALGGFGSVPSGGTVDLVITPAAAASGLSAGLYTANIEVTDIANGIVSDRSKSLEVGIAQIAVDPQDDIMASGPEGGPFVNASRTYTISNPRNFPVNYSISANQSWITLNGGTSTIAGTLSGLGDSIDVTVGLSSAADSFGIGPFSGNVTFDNTLGTTGDTTISYDLQVGVVEILSPNVPVAITDNTTVESTLEILDAFCITDLDVIIDISHTFIGDLNIDLIGPDGTEVRLHARTGGTTDDIMAVYDDQGSLPPAGPGTLADYNFTGAQGVWTLRVSDNAGADQGQINSWGLIVDAATDCPPSASDQIVEVPISTQISFDLNGSLNGPTGSFIVTSLPSVGTLRDAGDNSVISSVPYTLIGGGRTLSFDPGSALGGTTIGWEAMNAAGTAPATATLVLGGPVVVADFNMDSNPGWTMQGQWEWGPAVALTDDDPAAPATGTNLIGYAIGAEYPNNLPETYLTTGAIDMTGISASELRFQRWLDIESSTWDHASIDVSNDGSTWVQIFDHADGTQNPTDWTEVSYDISAVADGEATVFIRWTMGTTDGSVTHGGWSIDDVQILGVPEITDPGPSGCNPADLNDAAAPNPAAPNFGVPDGILTPTDFSAFAFYFSTGDLAADINDAAAASPAFPNFGVPDGILTPTDFSAFATYFGAGCPCTLPGCP